MRATFLVYQKDGRKGNDLTVAEPFTWLLQNRRKYPEAELAILSWLIVDVNQYEFAGIQSQIGIDYDEEKRNPKPEPVIDEAPEPEPEPAPIKRPRGWAFKNEYVDPDGTKYHKGVKIED